MTRHMPNITDDAPTPSESRLRRRRNRRFLQDHAGLGERFLHRLATLFDRR